MTIIYISSCCCLFVCFFPQYVCHICYFFVRLSPSSDWIRPETFYLEKANRKHDNNRNFNCAYTTKYFRCAFIRKKKKKKKMKKKRIYAVVLYLFHLYNFFCLCLPHFRNSLSWLLMWATTNKYVVAVAVFVVVFFINFVHLISFSFGFFFCVLVSPHLFHIPFDLWLSEWYGKQTTAATATTNYPIMGIIQIIMNESEIGWSVSAA